MVFFIHKIIKFGREENCEIELVSMQLVIYYLYHIFFVADILEFFLPFNEKKTVIINDPVNMLILRQNGGVDYEMQA